MISQCVPRRGREACCSHRPLVRRALRLSSFLQWTIIRWFILESTKQICIVRSSDIEMSDVMIKSRGIILFYIYVQFLFILLPSYLLLMVVISPIASTVITLLNMLLIIQRISIIFDMKTVSPILLNRCDGHLILWSLFVTKIIIISSFQ